MQEALSNKDPVKSMLFSNLGIDIRDGVTKVKTALSKSRW